MACACIPRLYSKRSEEQESGAPELRAKPSQDVKAKHVASASVPCRKWVQSLHYHQKITKKEGDIDFMGVMNGSHPSARPK